MTMTRNMSFNRADLRTLQLVKKNSHKGDNGKVLVIGGSNLFHSASIWAAELLAHFVDLVFYFSPAHINEEVLLSSKVEFRNGIIVPPNSLDQYIREADVVLIGPGMCRRGQQPTTNRQLTTGNINKILLTEDEGELTHLLVNTLLREYPHKKWVIDAGALQEVELEHVSENMILTPHWGEYVRLFPQFHNREWNEKQLEEIFKQGTLSTRATWLLKHQDTDFVFSKRADSIVSVTGGNEGLVKGGTGDLLSALVAAFFVKNNASLAAASASFVLKSAADNLYRTNGPFYTTTKVLQAIPGTLWELMS